MFKFTIVILTISCFGYNAYGWTDCGSKSGAIESISVSDCGDMEERCVLKRGTNATIHLTFKPNVEEDAMKVDVHGIIMGIPAPFEVPNPDGCKDSGVTCPLKSGQNYTYTSTFPVLAMYPRLTLDVKWELQDKDGNDIVCALIPAKIK